MDLRVKVSKETRPAVQVVLRIAMGSLVAFLLLEI